MKHDRVNPNRLSAPLIGGYPNRWLQLPVTQQHINRLRWPAGLANANRSTTNPNLGFLEDDIIKGSKVLREIDLQEKRMFVSIPMVEEPYFSIPIEVPPTVVPTKSETSAANAFMQSLTMESIYCLFYMSMTYFCLVVKMIY
jgi:hypothetical protein